MLLYEIIGFVYYLHINILHICIVIRNLYKLESFKYWYKWYILDKKNT